MKKKAVLGLSGGVDSSLAAALLTEAGFAVTGVYLRAAQARDESGAAQAAADAVGIPLVIEDVTEALEREVCSYFAAEYGRGRTPSPCIRCNPRVKFARLTAAADRLGAETVATGHYARMLRLPGGELAIGTGKGRSDQSYMLCRLDRALYPRLAFPLGGYEKSEIRAMAAARGIPAAARPDSMEICFIPDGDRIAFLERRLAGAEGLAGNFVDPSGRTIAPHGGLYRYTVGQRKGLGVALGAPVYVSDVDPDSGNVTLSPAGGEFSREVSVSDCLWHLPAEDRFEADVRVRHSAGFTRGTVTRTGTGAELWFPDGIRAAAPGQEAVFYRGGAIVGCGTIRRRGERR